MSKELKIVFVGHVDHGKSTLIGRMLYETGAFPEQKYNDIKKICEKQGKEFEYAFLLDAFEEEQTQGVTIDVSYIKFKHKEKDYCIIDAPGHKEFLKNMVTGASYAEAAVLLIDADEGIQEQTKKHSLLLNLIGIKNIIVVINKMDIINYNQEKYLEIKKGISSILEKLKFKSFGYIPICAKNGDNIIQKSKNLEWYNEKTFLECLDSINILNKTDKKLLRFPIQDVYKFDDKRILVGRVESGSLSQGDKVVFLPSNKSTTIKSIESIDLDKEKEVHEGQSIGITLSDQLFIERGELCSLEENCPFVSNKFTATIFWMGNQDLKKEKSIIIKLGTQEVQAKIINIEGVMNSDNLDYSSNKELVSKNDVAKVSFECDSLLAFDSFNTLQKTGRFVIVDGHEICGGGIINEGKYPDRRTFFSQNIKSKNITWEKGKISTKDREKLNNHKSVLIWLTGLSGSGKSAIAKELELRLYKRNIKTFILDGDNIRQGINKDLGFSPEDRVENIRRIGEVANLFVNAGFITITAFISPYGHDRERVRKLTKDKFIEVFLDCLIEECQKRDRKGLYKKALAGEIKNFTGISAPYEKPNNPELIIKTHKVNLDESLNKIISYLEQNNFI